jgi:hypothetical protein
MSKHDPKNCVICGNELLNLTMLSRHVRVVHKLSAKEYYIKYLKKPEDGICIVCNKPTQFMGCKGYSKTCCDSCETIHRSENIHNLRKDPNSKLNSQSARDKRIAGLLRAHQDQNSGFFTCREKLSNTLKLHYKSNPIYAKRISETQKSLHSDPDSIYNSEEYKSRVQSGRNDNLDPSREKWIGFGKSSYASDGHFCGSMNELFFENWLIKNDILHIPHPKIFDRAIANFSSRRADQYINGFYIEVDGICRSDDYWMDKYGRELGTLIILKPNNLTDKFLDKNLLELFTGIVM